MLHDVGKVALERSILHKPGALTPEEWEQVREHPARSAHILGAVQRFAEYIPGARHHHERYDGRGYPDGLAGAAIPLPARILRLADSADAMLHARPYRGAMSPEETTSELNRLAAVSYDPDLARVFVNVVLPQFIDDGGLDADKTWTGPSYDTDAPEA